MKMLSIKVGLLALMRLLVVISIFAFLQFAQADCDLRIMSAGPCLADGTLGILQVGDDYALRVTVNVRGTPTQPFRIKWTIANTTRYSNNINVGPGNGYSWYRFWRVDLDDPMPWSVTLDPDGVSGDTNLVNSTASGTFTPAPPAMAVELYSPRMMHGSETYTLTYQPGSGTIDKLHVLFGVPTSHGAQSVVSVSAPPDSHHVVTPPYDVPLFELAWTNVPASTFQGTDNFIVQLNSFRVNPTILRTNTWADMSTLATNWTQWIAPDQRCQSTDPLITSFVQQFLPADYQTTLTPYDTARTLHRAVMKTLTYQSPPLHLDAVNVLQDGIADCGGFAALLTACLRNVGIPARCISGFRQGDTVWHVRVEFHLPGVDWLVADPTDGNTNDPTGTYAYDFGSVRNAKSFLAVDVGDAHILPYHNFTFIQVPNWWWNGGATVNSYAAASYLEPNGVLCLTNEAKGSTSFYLNDVPTEGLVVLQTSTNLSVWSPVVTNTASGSVINYSFPNTDGLCRFYRANVIP